MSVPTFLGVLALPFGVCGLGKSLDRGFKGKPGGKQKNAGEKRRPQKRRDSYWAKKILALTGSVYKNMCTCYRDPIIHLNMATCKWVPFVWVEKATCVNWLRNGDLQFRSPASGVLIPRPASEPAWAPSCPASSGADTSRLPRLAPASGWAWAPPRPPAVFRTFLSATRSTLVGLPTS